jgi:hypothetical protein
LTSSESMKLSFKKQVISEMGKLLCLEDPICALSIVC